MITNRRLEAGTTLAAVYKGEAYFAKVLETEGPTVEITDGYRTDLIGSQYKSLSKAAFAITGNSVNGWRFWRVPEEGEEVKPREKEDSDSRRALVRGLFKRIPNQQGVEQGNLRVWCNGCANGFIAEGVKTIYEIEECPKGHRPEQFAEE